MGIKSNIQIDEINAVIRKRIEDAEKVIVNTLMYIGEMCVKEARSNGDYLDQTGNLRSSIGYVVVKNGKKVIENIKQAKRGSQKTKGVSEAKAFIDDLVSKHSRGIVLIVVAGMNYASYVEARRNVIASAQLLAEREVPRMMRELGLTKKI